MAPPSRARPSSRRFRPRKWCSGTQTRLSPCLILPAVRSDRYSPPLANYVSLLQLPVSAIASVVSHLNTGAKPPSSTSNARRSPSSAGGRGYSAVIVFHTLFCCRRLHRAIPDVHKRWRSCAAHQKSSIFGRPPSRSEPRQR